MGNLVEHADYCIIGGGIVGLATAYHLLRKDPTASLVLLEASDRLASHQTGRNSGVIHSGIYYAPDPSRRASARRAPGRPRTLPPARDSLQGAGQAAGGHLGRRTGAA